MSDGVPTRMLEPGQTAGYDVIAHRVTALETANKERGKRIGAVEERIGQAKVWLIVTLVLSLAGAMAFSFKAAWNLKDELYSRAKVEDLASLDSKIDGVRSDVIEVDRALAGIKGQLNSLIESFEKKKKK